MKLESVSKYMRAFLLLLFACHISAAQTNSPLAKKEQENFNKFLERHNARLRAEPPHAVIRIEQPGGTRKVSCEIGYMMGKTNLVVYKPLPNQAFDARLFDQNGKEIPKAWFNFEFGRPLKPDKKLLDGTYDSTNEARWGNPRKLNSGGCSHYWDFDVVKSFRINAPGQYRLEVQVRMFVKDTNGVFQPFILPPVETAVTISEAELE
jgi:hypothetical protein